VRDAYGPNFERLAAPKNRFDQTDFLTGNRIIKPSSDPLDERKYPHSATASGQS
jgi:hypothetical protein